MIPFCPINLDQPPQIAFLGNGTFGPTAHSTYCLPTKWALHCYNYEAELRLDDGEWMPLRPGMIGFTPPGATAVYRWPRARCTHAAAHFRLPDPTGSSPSVPLLIDLGTAYAECHDLLQAAIARFPSTPRRAEAMLWSLLWTLADRAAGPAAGGQHPAVRAAVGHIEQHLAEPLTVARVVRAVGISHNHLTRLFRTTHGTGVLGYIHRRRVDRAVRLLRETAWPIKAVAADVGVPDLQRFNKLIRKERGCSPRELRKQGTA